MSNSTLQDPFLLFANLPLREMDADFALESLKLRCRRANRWSTTVGGLRSLRVAIRTNDLDKFVLLIRDVKAIGRIEGYEDLHGEALLHDRIRFTRTLLVSGVKILDNYFKHAWLLKNYEFLSVCLENGFDINLCNPPILFEAIVISDIELCRWFLDRGANPNALYRKDDYCDTPTSWAVRHASIETIQLLLNHHASVEQGHLLHHAVKRETLDRNEVVSLILEKRPALNDIQFKLRHFPSEYYLKYDLGTPLYYAARKGHLDTVRLLLEHGANPFIKSSFGWLPIDAARRQKRKEVHSYLRNWSIEINEDPKERALAPLPVNCQRGAVQRLPITFGECAENKAKRRNGDKLDSPKAKRMRISSLLTEL